MKTVQEAIEFLSDLPDPLFPRNALQKLVDNPETATPYLLNYLQAFADDPQTYLDDDNTDLIVPAVYLLAQFREVLAFQPLLLLLEKLDDEGADIAFGDTISEGVSRSLASVSNGNVAAIQTLAENPKVNHFVRASAFYSLVTLACQGAMPRDDLKAYCRELLEGRLAYEGEYLRVCLTEVCLMMGFHDLKDIILENFKRWPQMKRFIRVEEMEDIFLSDEKSDQRGLSFHQNYITDAIADMEKWHTLYEDIANKMEEDDMDLFPSFDDYETVETFVREYPKVGRNDPCPCGSGKKYKKCCMN